jgi:uncharacterized protein
MNPSHRTGDAAPSPSPPVGARNLWEPVAPAERYHHIDVIRGLALFGVLLVNELSMYRVPLLEHILGRDTGQSPIDSFVNDLVDVTLEFKAITIFSFLFGVGIAIQTERASTGGGSAPASFLARRMTWLFLFGVVHMLLIWNGDILALYGLCGLMLLPVLQFSRPALLILGALLIASPQVVPLPLRLPSGELAEVNIAQAREIYGGGNLLSILRFRLFEAKLLILPLLAGILPRTVGLIVWGIVSWRSGILRRPEDHKRKLSFAFVCACAAAMFVPNVPIVVAAAYVTGLLLLLSSIRPSRLRGLAAAGRMALTNYLLQSVILGLIFYGYGFGLLGHVGSATAAGIGTLLYLIQVKASSVWLRHFRFGPFEWLWRSLTYGKRQPMRYVTTMSGMTARDGGSI